MSDDRDPRRIPFRAMIPNAVTALALCFGLTGVSLAIKGDWERALGAVVFAGVLDGFDGRIARLLRAQSKFGAELDSLSDNIAFGTAPALILFLWSLQSAPRFGWIAALALAVCCALRLARFNARIDAAEQPHKSAGFNTGVPAPAGAGTPVLKPADLCGCSAASIRALNRASRRAQQTAKASAAIHPNLGAV